MTLGMKKEGREFTNLLYAHVSSYSKKGLRDIFTQIPSRLIVLGTP